MASIRKLASGRYQAQYRPIPGGAQITRTTRKKADAQNWLAEQMAAAASGQHITPNAGKITLKSYFEEWSVRQIWTSNTRRSITETILHTPFSHFSLRLLERRHIETWIKDLETGVDDRRPLAPTSIRTLFGHVRMILRAAIRDKRIAENPCEGVKLPRVRRAESAMKLPSPETVRSLILAASPQFRVFISVCAFAGLRSGEASALQVKDIDFKEKLLYVSRQAQRSGTSLEVRLPKNGSERKVFLAGQLADLLSQHLATLPQKSPDSWLFPSPSNGPVNRSSIKQYWSNTRRIARADGVRLHDLRHFFASGLIAAGCDVVTVQRALGHSNATVTLGVYAHLWPTAQDRTRSAASSLITDVMQRSDEYLTNNASSTLTTN